MAIKYRFRATKSLGLTVTVYAGNEDDAEEQRKKSWTTPTMTSGTGPMRTVNSN